MRRPTLFLTLTFFLACGATAGMLASGLVPAGLVNLLANEARPSPYVVDRPSDNLVEVSDARWFLSPFLFGDFDLQMDVEVSEGAELDLLLRQVEPHIIDGQLLPFAGRFSVLRLSTDGDGDGDGDGWRTRDQALLGPKGNGIGIAPGHLATIWVEARGRELHANVAGKKQPTFVADDLYGMTAMVVKGGKAVIHRFEITPRGSLPMWPWSSWTWGAIGMGAAGLVLCLALAMKRALRLLPAGALMVVYAWLLARGIDLELAFPTMLGLGAALGIPLLLAVMVLLMPGTKWKWLFVPLAVIALLVGTSRSLPWPGLARALVNVTVDGFQSVQGVVLSLAKTTDSSAIDAVFGPKAGAQISEAHALLVRGPTGLLNVGRPGPCVFLLGGQLLYDQGMPADHMALMLERQLRGELAKPVDVTALPTADGYSSQQWLMFLQFYQAFEPAILVLGIGAEECAVVDDSGQPRSSRANVRETILAARKFCTEQQRHLVLFADEGVPGDILLELREHAAAGVPLVVAKPGRSRSEIADSLAAVCKSLLK